MVKVPQYYLKVDFCLNFLSNSQQQAGHIIHQNNRQNLYFLTLVVFLVKKIFFMVIFVDFTNNGQESAVISH